MIVENIDYSDKFNLVILTIEGEDFSISYDLYNELAIVIGKDLSFDTYKRILADDQYNKAKNLALDKISFARKTSFEISKILKDESYSLDVIARVIKFLEEYKLIDDRSYVKDFILDKDRIAKWSKNKIYYALRFKNISDELINTYIDEISSEREYEKALAFAYKKAGHKRDDKTYQKVYRHLASKGFDFDIIDKVSKEIFK